MEKNPGNARRQLIGWLLAALTMIVGVSQPVTQLCTLPDKLFLTEGYTKEMTFILPVRSEAQNVQVLTSTDQKLGDASAISLNANRTGTSDLTLKLLGLFPFKRVSVRVQPERVLIPGGQSVGVAIRTNGVMIVGASDLSGGVPSPARLAGLKAGDRIESVDGISIGSASELTARLADGGEKTLTICRGEEHFTTRIQPILDDRDGKYRLGAWVRDSTAGVGTLSFYDPESQTFGALGHAITDVDTGSMLTVNEGELLESNISGVHRGESGKPGELVGEFSSSSQLLGSILKNSSFGIYGSCSKPIENPLYPDGIPVMARSEVHLGKAQLLTTLDDAGVQAYDCEIVRLADQSNPSPRSMVVKVTDKRLLVKTGGIVQGMSGSPIIQDGRLAGAVTHVYVNDPTQGFGLYIEWMLDYADRTETAA